MAERISTSGVQPQHSVATHLAWCAECNEEFDTKKIFRDEQNNYVCNLCSDQKQVGDVHKVGGVHIRFNQCSKCEVDIPPCRSIVSADGGIVCDDCNNPTQPTTFEACKGSCDKFLPRGALTASGLCFYCSISSASGCGEVGIGGESGEVGTGEFVGGKDMEENTSDDDDINSIGGNDEEVDVDNPDPGPDEQ